jgi:hypothetical protein
MALNFGTAFQYDTSLGSQQTSMLAAQDAAFSGAGSDSSFFGATAGVTSVVGALSSIYGAYQASNTANYQASVQNMNLRSQAIQQNLSADIARLNARSAENTAQGTLLAGQRAVQSQRMKSAQLKSTQRASMAANGIDLGSDTAVNILTTTDVLSEIDSNTIEANAIRAAWGYRTNSVSELNRASMANANANMSLSAQYGGMNTGGAVAASLIGGATNVASTFYRLNRAGVFN